MGGIREEGGWKGAGQVKRRWILAKLHRRWEIHRVMSKLWEKVSRRCADVSGGFYQVLTWVLWDDAYL